MPTGDSLRSTSSELNPPYWVPICTNSLPSSNKCFRASSSPRVCFSQHNKYEDSSTDDTASTSFCLRKNHKKMSSVSSSFSRLRGTSLTVDEGEREEDEKKEMERREESDVSILEEIGRREESMNARRNGQKRSSGIWNDPVITINVSGMRFQTYQSTLERFPHSMLGNPTKRRAFWNEQLNEYFLDRSRTCFESILHIYRTGGQVVRPVTVPVEMFIDELYFYQLKDDVWSNFCESEGCRIVKEEKKPLNPTQRKIWNLMEHPDSSFLARILASISVAVIIISTVSFCLESIPELKSPTDREWSSPFFWIEFCCCLWFSIELVIRFIVAPSRTDFMKSFLNVLDFVAVAPFFINLILHDAENKNSSSTSFAVLRIVRLVRVFRIFKLSRHFTGLQVLGKTFRASIQEFFLLIFFMGIALVLFSSGVYFAEQGEPGTKFTSIPATFWFVLATMTTVGYGDLVPNGVYGKIVGSCCALIGVLTLALPVPIIVANFKRFYRQEVILAKMYEQNSRPEEISAFIKQKGKHGGTFKISINGIKKEDGDDDTDVEGGGGKGFFDQHKIGVDSSTLLV
uniref:BTB domain-containing protein n=1 Tax=Meloidogyne incognita TaxID=6306 RepID=A0A914L957_MELIC